MKIKNLFSIALDAASARIFNRRIPVFVSWQITERCNLRCKYCDYWSGAQEDELSTAQALAIIDELSVLKARVISFTGGEPLLRDDIRQIITYAKSKGIFSKINTNGLLVPQKIDEIDGAEQVNLSFDGPAPIHDQIRGAGSYKALFTAIDLLRRRKKRIVFHVVLTKHNLSSVDFILDKCRELDIGAFFQPATEFYLLGKDRNPHSPDKEDYNRVISLLLQKKRNKNVYINNSLSGLKHLSCWPDPRNIYCCAGKIIIRINPKGQLYHCERFPDKNKISFRDGGVRSAIDHMQFFNCSECWCGPLIELNLAMSGKLDAIANAFKL